jgi:hypothetical protein
MAKPQYTTEQRIFMVLDRCNGESDRLLQLVVGITWTQILNPGRRTLNLASLHGLHRLDSISAAGDGLVAISLRALDKPFPARGPQT